MTNKTNENNSVFNKETKTKVGRGATAAFGAILGAFGGAAASEAFAGETEEVATEEPVVDEAASAHAYDPAPKPTPEPAPEPSTPEPSTPESPTTEPHTPEPTTPEPPSTEPTVEVIDYQTVETENGTADFATVSVDEDIYVIADMDRDGWADLIASDQNQNGSLEEGEVEVLQGHELAMEPLRQEFEQGQIASNDIGGTEPDYINDGNVDDFMA